MNRPAQLDLQTGRPLHWHDCTTCDAFALDATAYSFLPEALQLDQAKRMLVRHTLFKIHEGTQLPVLEWEYLKRLLDDGTLPTAQELADNLMRWLGKHSPGPGESVEIWYTRHAAALGSRSPEGLLFVLKSMISANLIDGALSVSGGGAGGVLHLILAGWERFEQLKRATVDSRVAFMAMKFGDSALDQAYRDCFKGAVARTGFELRRLDEKQPAGLIDNQLRVAIRGARFLVADLTHGSHGAYWEAGFAEGLGKPVIYTCEKSHFEQVQTHFDTNHHLTIRWTVEELTAAANDLAATIRNTLPAEAKLTDG
jgi:hypothetical protein